MNKKIKTLIDNFYKEKTLSEKMDPEEWSKLVDEIKNIISTENEMTATLIYEVAAAYSDDGKTGVNPLKLKFEVHKAGDSGLYNEIAVDCINEDGVCVGNVYIGLCQDKKDMRVLLTTDGEGDGDQTIAVYPMRSKNEACDLNWG